MAYIRNLLSGGVPTSQGVVFTRPQISYLKLPPNLDTYSPWNFVKSIGLHSVYETVVYWHVCDYSKILFGAKKASVPARNISVWS
jgi:hypothetical protein